VLVAQLGQDSDDQASSSQFEPERFEHPVI
jgi:hypothetical protein